ncbi:MAG: hypothetical protein IJJ83_09180 [Muribaculaceae bacterium]|nr:hypothetical protein [Muribaculaceae bacterium]
MKKFLFTLAALLMAGSLCAEEYFFMDDIQLTQEEAANGCAKVVNVKAHFDYAVSAWEANFTLPEGVTIGTHAKGSDLTLTFLGLFEDEETLETYYQETTYTPDLATNDDKTKVIVSVYTTKEYDEAGNAYGVSWRPGDYEQMWRVRLVFPAGFQGGDIVLNTAPACGNLLYPGLEPCPKNQNNQKVCTVSVEGGSEPEVTATPVINWDEETFTVSATGAGTVKLYVNGVEVENPYTFELGEEETTYTVTATAQEEGKEISETATLEVTVPAAPVVIEVTPKPIIDVFDDPEAQTVTVKASGYGHICLYWDDQLMAEGEGEAVWVISYGEDPEGEEYGVSATAQEEGKEVSEYARATVFVPGKSVEPQPYETPAPEIVETMTDDALLITANGEGTVTLYVQTIDNETGEMTTETYEGEGTVSAVIPRGEETYYINYWAVAQANEDAEPGSTQVSYFVEVPAKEVTPVNPDHEQGVWIVTFLNGGEEFWQEMLPSNEDYTCIVRFSYGNYGTFPYDPNKSMAENDAMRPDMPFYIVIDGVRYGAAEDGTLCVLGTALSNELFENENLYVLEHALGRVYNMGVAIDELDPSKKYVYAAVAAYTELEEMNASKTVAGVRYFNMAGQEMQEANGMTIVVTTYTDGTTSAVKVMK